MSKKTRPEVPPAVEAVAPTEPASFSEQFAALSARSAAAVALTEPAPPMPPARSRVELGAELVALQIAYSVTASGHALNLLRHTADEYLETFR